MATTTGRDAGRGRGVRGHRPAGRGPRPAARPSRWAPATTRRWCAAADGRMVVSTDMLVEGRHFRLDWSTPHDVGRKAIAQNAADIEAMGARADRVRRRIRSARRHPGRPGGRARRRLVGTRRGCSARASSAATWSAAPQWVISVTALGDLGGRAPVRRGGARPGDTRGRHRRARPVGGRIRVVAQRDHRQFDELRRRHLVPEPPYGQGAVAAAAGATVDDRCLRRAARRRRAHRRRLRRRRRPVALTRCAPTTMRWPRRPRRVGPTRGTGCSAAAKTTRWSRRSRARRRAGWRVIGTGARRPAAGAGRRCRDGAVIRAGSRSD